MTDSLQRPTGSLVPPPTGSGPTILGFPAEPDDAVDAAPGPVSRLVVLRRPDRLGCALLVLAGVATNVSLWLPWLPGRDAIGLSLVGQGVDALGSGDDLWTGAVWQPLAVVLGGGLLLVLGMLLLIPGHAHRFVGVLALLVAMATGAVVLELLVDAGWRADRLALGAWFAVAVPVLGLLGSLKAMLTAPHVTVAPR
jgi:hypothetical protein